MLAEAQGRQYLHWSKLVQTREPRASVSVRFTTTVPRCANLGTAAKGLELGGLRRSGTACIALSFGNIIPYKATKIFLIIQRHNQNEGRHTMITRYALFQGEVPSGKLDQFKAAVLEELLPTWRAYPGALAVRVSFAWDRDDQAADLPLILAVDFETREQLKTALGSKERLDSRAATERVLPGLFRGKTFHYLTETSEHLVS